MARYNGWENYETWAVKLWLDNDYNDYKHWQAVTKNIWKHAAPTSYSTRKQVAERLLADTVKGAIENGNPIYKADLYSDLLSSAIQNVNWYEIAESYLNDYAEEAESEEVE